MTAFTLAPLIGSQPQAHSRNFAFMMKGHRWEMRHRAWIRPYESSRERHRVVPEWKSHQRPRLEQSTATPRHQPQDAFDPNRMPAPPAQRALRPLCEDFGRLIGNACARRSFARARCIEWAPLAILSILGAPQPNSLLRWRCLVLSWPRATANFAHARDWRTTLTLCKR